MSAIKTLEALALDVNASLDDLTEQQKQEIELLTASTQEMNAMLQIHEPDVPDEEPNDEPSKES